MEELCHWQNFESPDYEAVYAQQQRLVQQRLDGIIPDTILMGEHAPVLTLGRGTNLANILQTHIPTVSIERGGDVTYHGPGQLVVYPIIKLEGERKDLHRYLRTLEQMVMDVLAEFGMEGYHYQPKSNDSKTYTGVWVNAPNGNALKIASIGVAVKRWVTCHGVALNVNTDLLAYQAINPCGFSADVMTSMQAILGKPVDMADVKQALKKATHHHLCHVQ